jgi:endoglucanase
LNFAIRGYYGPDLVHPGRAFSPRKRFSMFNPVLPVAALLSVAIGLLSPAHVDSASRDAPAMSKQATAARSTGASDNPFRAYSWGDYQGPMEPSWTAYRQASGKAKRRLAYIAQTPKAHWFGHWNDNDKVIRQVHDYIANAQDGNPNALVQMAVFRVVPWEHDACRRLPTAAEQASYKQWVKRFAAAVGNTPTAVILQPDGPFALCAPHGSKLPSKLVAYAARVLSGQPRTSVYVEAGAADWPMFGPHGGVDAAVKILVRGGIQYAHGFALNSTHEDSVTGEVGRATAIAKALAAKGYPGRKAVINTSSNGHPYRYGTYTGPDALNPVVCPSKTTPASVTCETLGIQPTADVANARWGLSDKTAKRARHHVDAYLWFGRPWLHHVGSQPFVTKRAIKLVKSTPWR